MMKRSLTFSFLAVACIGVMVAAATAVRDHAVGMFTRVADFGSEVFKAFAAPFESPKAGEVAEMKPKVLLFRAKQLMQRWLKRDTMTMTDRYRMCPSV